jgi:hypothetical protein
MYLILYVKVDFFQIISNSKVLKHKIGEGSYIHDTALKLCGNGAFGMI